tara:strand:+ start:68 stop:403 length:336 start_codon:yes stop_codon:yes gene_type:complete
MDLTGKLVGKLEQETGTSKAGKAWAKQICLLETDNEFNNLVAIECFGEEKIKQMNKLREGDMVTISCNIYSEEWKGKYFNKIRGFRFVNGNELPTDNREEFVTTDDNDLPF